MSSFDWESFLKQWSRVTLESIGNDQGKWPPDVVESGWLGYPGATEKQIARAEARLGTSLPPSYRAFLKVTNGWRQTTPFINRLWSVEEIEWFAVRHQAWIGAFLEKFQHSSTESPNANSPPLSIADEDYFVYGEEQDCSKLRVEYLQTALEISKRGEGAIYLLNPQVVTPEGEWEAWFFGDWLPGADRYRSFQDMMQAEYENFLELREPPATLTEPRLDDELGEEPETHQHHLSPTDEIPSPSASVSPEPELSPIEVHSPPLAPEDWNELALFTIEVQTRELEGHIEQRTLIRHEETGSTETQANIDTASVQQWMLNHLKGYQLYPQVEEPVALQIQHLRVIRSSQPDNPGVITAIDPFFPDILKRGEPFALEVGIGVVESATANLVEQELICQIQCVARDLSSRLNVDLGRVTLNNQRKSISKSTPSVHTALFPEIILEQPGMYCFKVWVALQNVPASPASFKVPRLDVV